MASYWFIGTEFQGKREKFRRWKVVMCAQK